MTNIFKLWQGWKSPSLPMDFIEENVAILRMRSRLEAANKQIAAINSDWEYRIAEEVTYQCGGIREQNELLKSRNAQLETLISELVRELEQARSANEELLDCKLTDNYWNPYKRSKHLLDK